MRLPLSVKAFVAIDKILSRLRRAHSILGEELLWTLLSVDAKERTNAVLYAQEAQYLDGGRHFERGLFPWEEEVLRLPELGNARNVVVGGAGAGREAFNLAARGWHVWAFDPCPEFVENASDNLKNFSNLKYYQASYADLVDAIEFNKGPLASLTELKRLDLILLGWGSFSYLIDPNLRKRLLKACLNFAPTAPVFMSFLAEEERGNFRSDWLRRALRTFLRISGAKTHPNPGDAFSPSAPGFIHVFTPGEIIEIARDSGYTVHSTSLVPYPFAVLFPKTYQPVPGSKEE